jgi:hypothetical protein
VIETVLVLPQPPALLEPRSVIDPVGELRTVCDAAVADLPPGRRLIVLAARVPQSNAARGVTEPLGHRVARQLLAGAAFESHVAVPDAVGDILGITEPATLIVMADGSARRGEKAPGHVHPEAIDFDDAVEAALRAGDAEALAGLDPEVGAELWCEGVPGFRLLGALARGRVVAAELIYADAPYGVAWWVARWDLAKGTR